LLRNGKLWHNPLVELKQATVKIMKQATQMVYYWCGVGLGVTTSHSFIVRTQNYIFG
jgi:hypothetical protein